MKKRDMRHHGMEAAGELMPARMEGPSSTPHADRFKLKKTEKTEENKSKNEIQ